MFGPEQAMALKGRGTSVYSMTGSRLGGEGLVFIKGQVAA